MPESRAHISNHDRPASDDTAANKPSGKPAASTRRISSGFEAVAAIEAAHSDLLYLTADIVPPAHATDVRTADIRTADSSPDLFSGLFGGALTGLRTAGIAEADSSSGLDSIVREAARQHTPALLHFGCGDSHDAFASLGQTGALQFFAADVQEAADMACIARRAAESALVPAVCGCDTERTAEALHTISAIDVDALASWLGHPADDIKSPTPAQSMVFGDHRRRVPQSFNLDRPLGLGAPRDADMDLQADAARAAFFADHVASAVDDAMQAFADLTGRRYGRVSPYRMEDAEVAVLVQGALSRDLRAVVDYLRSEKGIRAGCLSLTLFRPFPSDLLASLLQGISAVTILEKAAGTPIEHRPLYRDVCVMVDTAELGAVLSGTYGGGRAAPSFEDLCAVYVNMTAGESARRDFLIGARFEVDEPRMPALERMQRQIRRAWPALKNRVLASTPLTASGGAQTTRTIRLETTPDWDGRLAARLLAEGLFDVLGEYVEVQPVSDRRAGDPDVIDIRRSGDVRRSGAHDYEIQTLLAAHPRLLLDSNSLTSLAQGAVIHVVSGLDVTEIWETIPSRVRRTLQERSVSLRVVDASGIAREEAPDPRFETLLTTMAAVGVLAKDIPDDIPDEVVKAFLTRIDHAIPGPDSLRTAIRSAVGRCLSAVTSTAARDLELPASPDPEPDTPWPLKESSSEEPESARFWKSVGYPFESGEPEQVLADPFLASGAMPARSSAGHRPGSVRTEAPVFLPELCTACGACWSLCPDAALPVTIQDPKSLLETALDRAEADGQSVFALRRIQKHIADTAARLTADDELHRFTRVGLLLEEAWERVAPRLGLSDEKRTELDDTFKQVLERVETVPIARTEPFRSDGLLLSIAVDVDACTSCGLCVRSCPEDALEMREYDHTAREQRRLDLALIRDLPDVPLDILDVYAAAGDEPKPEYRLINRRVHDAMIGGETGAPGDGTRTALHLVLAAAEATMQPRVDVFRSELRELRTGLDDRIREVLSGAVEVNDLEALARRLSEQAGTPPDKHTEDLIDLHEVDRLLHGDVGSHTIDRTQLKLLARTRTDLDALLEAYEHAAHGDGRARMAAAFGPSNASGAGSTFPWNPYPFPWIFQLSERAPSIAEGLYEGVQSRMLDAFRTARIARLIVDRTYSPGEHDGMLMNLSRKDLTDTETRLCPPVVVVVDRTGPAVDRLLRSRLPINVLHIDTGRYASDGRDLGFRFPDEAALRAIAAGTAFVLQSSASVPDHLLSGAERGFDFDGPTFMSVHASDPDAHGIRPEEAAEDARRAVLSRTVPLLTFDPDLGAEISERLRLEGNPSPAKDLATVSTTVLSSTGRVVEATWHLTFADWAARQDRFRGHFTFAPRPEWHDNMIPVATYMDLTDEKREHLQPYVQIPAPDGQISRWIPSADVLREATRRTAIWNMLREMAGLKSGLADRIRAEAEGDAASRIADEQERMRASFETRLTEKLEERERTHAARYHQRLREELLHLSGFAGDGSHAGSLIRDYLDEGASGVSTTADEPPDEANA